MNILRRIVSGLILVVAVVALVGICISYNWGSFAAAFNPFDFFEMVDQLVAFFQSASNAIVLVVLGFIGLTMPSTK